MPSAKEVADGFLVFTAWIPSLFVVQQCHTNEKSQYFSSYAEAVLCHENPLIEVNLIFLWCCCLLFFAISVVEKSTWVISVP